MNHIPRRASKFGVGKLMGNCVYVHYTYQEEIVAEQPLKQAKQRAQGMDYTVVKYNIKTGNITFVQVPDFDTAPEPTVRDQLLVRPDGTTRYMKQQADPWIYHHKWLFVKDDYMGFDVEKSKQRSLRWLQLTDIDFTRIGKKSFWERTILSRL